MQTEEKYYTSDKPCKLGHLGLRLTATGTCIECRKIRERERYAANPEQARAKQQAYVSIHKDKVLAARKAAYQKNADKEKAAAKIRSAEWRKANPGHEGTRIAKRKYAVSAKGKATGSRNNVARRTGLKQATPLWVDMTAIADVYMEASYMQMEVDHIVPLRNSLVCGLHTWDNLQLMKPVENNRKGNRHWPDMPA